MTDARWILLVEDNPDDVELTRIAFREIGFPHKIVHVSDGAEALDFLFAQGKHAGRKKHDTPTLLLLDLKLPKVHGLEVLKKLRADALLKHIVVVVLTSSREEKDKLEAEWLGANLFVQKPVNYDEFIDIARRIENLLTTPK
jgi:two-component system, response regulator